MRLKFCSETHSNGCCPAQGKICKNCENKGYFAKCCTKKKNIHSLHQEYSDNTFQDDSPNGCGNFFIGTINVQTSNPSDSGDINRENTNDPNFSTERVSGNSSYKFLMIIQRSVTKETFQFKTKMTVIIYRILKTSMTFNVSIFLVIFI